MLSKWEAYQKLDRKEKYALLKEKVQLQHQLISRNDRLLCEKRAVTDSKQDEVSPKELVYNCVCVFACLCMYMCVCVCVCVCVCMCMCYMCVVCACVCVCVCVEVVC